LDTNALIWLLNSTKGEHLGENAKRRIEDASTVYASSISVLEVRIKELLGKLEAPETLLDDIKAAGLKNIAFTMEHADAIKKFPSLSRHDPFDRMLVAQAQTEGLTLLTSDSILLGLKVDFIVNARQ
jgi:PIN domain nuclease of toxin-antitoxin system